MRAKARATFHGTAYDAGTDAYQPAAIHRDLVHFSMESTIDAPGHAEVIVHIYAPMIEYLPREILCNGPEFTNNHPSLIV